jgi:uncharacterized membrane protein
MKTAGMIIIALACAGIAVSFFAQIGFMIAQRGAPAGGMRLLYFLMGLPSHIIWVFVGLGFIALDNKLDKITNRQG